MTENAITLEVVFHHLSREARDTRDDIRELRGEVQQIDRRLHAVELPLRELAERKARRWDLHRELIIAGVAAAVGRWSDHILGVAAAILPHQH
jgi:predicted RNA-binding protein